MRIRELFHQSLLFHILQWLHSRLELLPDSRIWMALRSYGLSERLCRKLERADRPKSSVFYRLGQSINRILCTLGQKIRPAWQQSRTARVVNILKEHAKESLLLGWAARRGGPTILFACLAICPVLETLFKIYFKNVFLTNSWNEFLLILGFLMIIIQRLRAETPRNCCLTPAALPLVQFPAVGLCLFVSVMIFPDIDRAGYYVTMGGMLWVLVITRIIRGEDDAQYLCNLMVKVAAWLSLVGVLEYIFEVPIPTDWLETEETEVRTRAFSIFANPNQFGEYIELMLPMGIGVFLLTTDKKEKAFFAGGVLLMIAAGLFTMSRGAWIAIAASLFVFALLEDRRLALVLVILGGAVLALPFVTARLTFLFSDAYLSSAAKGGRLLHWKTAIDYLRQGNPWLGLGFGMYGGDVANNNQVMRGWTYYWVDNYYVKILAENGIIGLISFALMQIGLLLTGLCAWAKVRHTRYRPLVAGLLAGMVGLLVHGAFECMLDVKFVSTIFWTEAGLMLWLGFLRERNSIKTKTRPLQAASV